MKRAIAAACFVSLVLLTPPSAAFADLPSWLRTENGHVEDGNELLAKGDAKAALTEYDKAARQLPEDPGVQLDRGLALLKLGELAKSREALVSATSASAQPNVRADAYRNLALAFYRDGDALAGQNKHQEAQGMFREAVDAAKRSLRLRPGDPNAAWNLELAARRLREEQAKQKAEDDKKKQDQKNDEKKDGDKQDGQPGDQGDKSDQKDQDQKQDQKDGQDQKSQDQAKQDQGKDQSQDQSKDAQKPEPPKADAGKDAQKPKPEPQKPEPGKDQAQQADAQQGKDDKAKDVPADVAQALDALKDGEQNFERVRARQRAAQENRAPEKDW